MDDLTFGERLTRGAIGGLIEGMMSDEGNIVTGALATGLAAVPSMAIAAGKLGYDFVDSLVPRNVIRDLPPLSNFADGPMGAALVGAAIRQTAQEQRQAEYESKEAIRRTAAMAYHQKMANQYQRTGQGYNQRLYHLSKVKRFRKQKGFRKQRYYGAGEGVLKAFSNYGRRKRSEFWQNFRKERDWHRGYLARRHDEARVREQWGGDYAPNYLNDLF